jgi:hypothetical protein
MSDSGEDELQSGEGRMRLQEPGSLGTRGGRSDTLCSKGRAFYLLHCVMDLNSRI